MRFWQIVRSRFSVSPSGAPLYDQSKKRWLRVLTLIFSLSPGEAKAFSANPVMPRIIGCSPCSSPRAVPLPSRGLEQGPGDAEGVEARAHGQVVGDGPEPIAPGDGRVLLDRTEMDTVLSGHGGRGDRGGLTGRGVAEDVVSLQAGLDLGGGNVAGELDVGHDRVSVEDRGQDDRERERRRRGTEDAPDLGRDAVLERREAVRVGL